MDGAQQISEQLGMHTGRDPLGSNAIDKSLEMKILAAWVFSRK